MENNKNPRNDLFVEIDAENVYISGFNVNPIAGYEVPTNEKTGEPLPFCCKSHTEYWTSINNWYQKFPTDCCDKHPKLLTKSWFKKELFNHVPKKVMTQISYTEYHISKRIDHSIWYKDITDYIQYNVHSFGHPPVGANMYLYWIGQYLKVKEYRDFVLPKDKRQKLVNFIENAFKPSDETPIDFNILYNTFRRWLSMFPDIEYFHGIKKQFEGTFPVRMIFYNPIKNSYSGLTRYSARTEKEFINFLTNWNEQLLYSIDTTDLVKKGLISDKETYAIELDLAYHKADQAKTVGGFRNGEQKYLETIIIWLKKEIRFLERIAPKFEQIPKLLGGNSIKHIDNKTVQKDPTFLELFRSNQVRLDKFWELLKSDLIKAVDNNNAWVYNSRKSSIVACFNALEELGYIKPNIPKASLQRIVSTEISFAGSEKLFRIDFNPDDFQEFYNLFEKSLK